MKTDSILKVVIAILIVALGALVYVQFAPPHVVVPPNIDRDGNPIGFDVVGVPTAQVPVLSGNGNCLTQKSCTHVEWHYLVNKPVPTCPGNVPSGAACSANQVRKLPSCPDGAQCITFISNTSQKEITVESQYAPSGYHGPEKTYAMGIVIFQ